MVSIWAIVVTFLGLSITIVGTLLGFFYFPDFVNEQIKESVRLREGSDAWDRWEVLPLAVVYKAYFFNVSNPQEVQNGAIPIVTEVGPYCYNQYRTKINITREDDILSYYQHMRFEFNEEASAPLTAYDEITIINVPLMTIILATEHIAGGEFSPLTALQTQIATLFGNPSDLFLRTTPQDILFDGVYVLCNNTGFITNRVCSQIEANAPVTMPRLEDGRFKFSLFAHKNDTHDGLYSIKSGINDVHQLGEIVAWENSSTVDVWEVSENATCNNIFGSDASLFPPFRTNESNIGIFSTDICRSVKIGYTKKTEYAGINGLRYEPGDDFLASASRYPDNQCFCLNKTLGINGDDGCLLDGAMELYDCLGGPLVLTFPHFSKADEKYKNGVIGTSPNDTLHGMFLDLEPNSGTLLRGSQRVQFNVFLKFVERITLTTNVNTTLMPILWVDEGIELTDDLISMLRSELIIPMTIVELIPWLSLIIGGLTFTGGFIWLVLSIPAISGRNEMKKIY